MTDIHRRERKRMEEDMREKDRSRDTAINTKVWVQEKWIERERQKKRGRVSQCWWARQVTFTVNHHSPLWPQDKMKQGLRGPLCCLLFHPLPPSLLIFLTDIRYLVMLPWRLRGWLSTKGCWLPGDHVSTDLHYNYYCKWLQYSCPST